MLDEFKVEERDGKTILRRKLSKEMLCEKYAAEIARKEELKREANNFLAGRRAEFFWKKQKRQRAGRGGRW